MIRVRVVIGLLISLFIVGCTPNEPFIVEVESSFISPTELKVNLITSRNTLDIDLRTIVLSYSQGKREVERSILLSASFQSKGTKSQSFIFNVVEQEIEEGILTFTYLVDNEEHIITHSIINPFFNK